MCELQVCLDPEICDSQVATVSSTGCSTEGRLGLLFAVFLWGVPSGKSRTSDPVWDFPVWATEWIRGWPRLIPMCGKAQKICANRPVSSPGLAGGSQRQEAKQDFRVLELSGDSIQSWRCTQQSKLPLEL